MHIWKIDSVLFRFDQSSFHCCLFLFQDCHLITKCLCAMYVYVEIAIVHVQNHQQSMQHGKRSVSTREVARKAL